MLDAVSKLFCINFKPEPILEVSEAWEPCRIVFDVVRSGERIAKLSIPATEHLRYRHSRQLDLTQIEYVSLKRFSSTVA